MSPTIHPEEEPPTFAIPTVMKHKIPKETEFNHAFEVVVALELEYKNIKFSVKPNLVGDLILFPPRPQHSQDPQRGQQPQREDSQGNTIRPRRENNQKGPTTISSGSTCRSFHKTSKSDQGRSLCYESGQSRDQASASGHQGDSPRGGRPRELGEYKLRPFVPEPLQSYKCQKFGHHQSRCHKKVRCGICSLNHKTEMCIKNHKEGTTKTAKCPNCGKKHYAWSISCLERREWMKFATAKIQPQNTTEAPQSTLVWGQQRQKTVNPTPTPPQLSEDSFPALPPPGYRTKLKTPGQNQSMQETLTNQWTPQPQLQSCIAVKAQNTPVLVENTILPGTVQPLHATTQLNTPSLPIYKRHSQKNK
ncbi:hypothetical protein Hamer_G026209 [Homarus americanus]|uniref:Nucleic-acid-binding protein from transposon X-element n=1 Tax=Homarus americanus TaxID=6706 RepID=A0A8J5TIL5_HOMAM|nr:hypothetical protein Hamer_G026209 [Homarus americanus]